MSVLMKIWDAENLLGKEGYLYLIEKLTVTQQSTRALCQELVQEKDTYLSNDI